MPSEARKDIRVELRCEGLPPGALSPVSMRVREAIGSPRIIEVDVVGSPPSADDLLRKGAQLDIVLGGEPTRRFEGIILRVKEQWRGRGPVLSLTLGSPLDMLALSTDARIFQDMTMPEIVKAVFANAGIPSSRVATRLSGTYVKMASCTQYGESMLAFVTRLLESEGAFYYLEDGSSGLTIVLGDSPDAHAAATPSELPWVFDTGLLEMNAVTEILELGAVRPAKVTLRDLDWKRPSLQLEAEAEAPKVAGERELYDYPGGYDEPAHGKRRAKFLLESFAAARTGIRGTAIAPGLSAGKTFTLTSGPRADLDIEWLVTEIEHTWSSAGGDPPYSSNFRAIPKTTPFRPPLRTPKPRIEGPQTAIVTGPAGQEIHTDEHGRVKLKFPWDRHASFDEKSSAWVRVAQLAMDGSMAIPRIGWEVLVEFEHGDPDRPIVVGRLFNAMYLPPYALPAKQTVSTLMSYSSPGGEGHNEIRFEDAAGAEHIHVHAQKDLDLHVVKDRTASVVTSRMVTIQADEAVTVKGNRSFEVKGLWDTTVAGNQLLDVTGARTKTVKKDEKLTVNGDRSLSVASDHAITADGNATMSVEGNVARTVGGSFDESADEALSLAVGDDLSVTIGGAKSEIAKMGKTDTTDGKRSETVGGAFVSVAGKDLGLMVGGKQTSTIGAAWSLTSGADVVMSSRDAMEMTIGAALTMTGATSISIKVGSSKVLVGQGGVVIEASKVKLTSDGPAAILGAIVGSK